MLPNWRFSLAMVIAVLAMGMAVRPAHAVGDLQLNVAGQSLNEVQLVLTDPQGAEVKQDDDSDRAAGYWWWRNRKPGTYTLRVMRNGQPVGQPQQVEVRDDVRTSYRVDATTGTVAMASSLSSRLLANFAIGLYGGRKWSPFDADVTTSLPSNGQASLGGDFGLFGVEGRYYLNPAQQFAQGLGARLFVYGSYVHYFGSPIEKFFLDDHPTNGEDVGAGVDEKWSGIVGVGTNLNIAQRLGLGLMLGAHMTRVQTIALANETGGANGQNNRFTDSNLVFGPVVAAELYYTVAYLQGIGALQWMLRGQMMWMPDSSVDGVSNLGFAYHARAEGGPQWSALSGIRLNF